VNLLGAAVALGNHLLDTCARAIADNVPRELDLRPLRGIWHDIEEGGTAYLAERVEEFTNGQRTICAADPILFATTAKGPGLLLAVCPAGSPQDIVTELGPGMILVELGPYQNGFKMPAPQASKETIERWRAELIRSERMSAERTIAEQSAHAFRIRLAELVVHAAAEVAPTLNDEERAELHDLVRIYAGPNSSRSWEGIAWVCVRIGITLEELARREPPTPT
jgi:hypothetical protein